MYIEDISSPSGHDIENRMDWTSFTGLLVLLTTLDWSGLTDDMETPNSV